ncbi:hypothetical protein AeMF1_018400 [Aphanomyces euteiches]|nr:hypothetical protein AeMF1_018400 [Aphanomyces euteiches]KAH9131375.1 hypothetical protein AeNC1_019668 [Aphanomyces euteiches]
MEYCQLIPEHSITSSTESQWRNAFHVDEDEIALLDETVRVTASRISDNIRKMKFKHCIGQVQFRTSIQSIMRSALFLRAASLLAANVAAADVNMCTAFPQCATAGPNGTALWCCSDPKGCCPGVDCCGGSAVNTSNTPATTTSNATPTTSSASPTTASPSSGSSSGSSSTTSAPSTASGSTTTTTTAAPTTTKASSATSVSMPIATALAVSAIALGVACP